MFHPTCKIIIALLVLFTIPNVVLSLPLAATNPSTVLPRTGLSHDSRRSAVVPLEYEDLRRRGPWDTVKRIFGIKKKTPEQKQQAAAHKELVAANKEYHKGGKAIAAEAKASMGSDYKNGPQVHCTNCSTEWEHKKAAHYAHDTWKTSKNIQQWKNANVEVSDHTVGGKPMKQFAIRYHGGDQITKSSVTRSHYFD